MSIFSYYCPECGQQIGRDYVRVCPECHKSIKPKNGVIKSGGGSFRSLETPKTESIRYNKPDKTITPNPINDRSNKQGVRVIAMIMLLCAFLTGFIIKSNHPNLSIVLVIGFSLASGGLFSYSFVRR